MSRLLAAVILASFLVACGPTRATPPTSATAPPSPAGRGGLVLRQGPLVALPQGRLVAGAAGNPIAWHPEAAAGVDTVTVIPEGVEFNLYQAHRVQYVGVPRVESWTNVLVDADVRFQSGTTDGAAGVGCLSDDLSEVFAFLVSTNGTWSIQEFNGPQYTGSTAPIIVHGSSAAIRASEANHLSVVCAQISPQVTQLGYAVNETPIANIYVRSKASHWVGALTQAAYNVGVIADYTKLADSTFP